VRLQQHLILHVFRNFGTSVVIVCVESLYGVSPDIHQASYIWMVYSYKVSTARTYLKYLSCMRQSPTICTHAWPSCNFDLSTYNNLTLPHRRLFLGHLLIPLRVEVHIVRRAARISRPCLWRPLLPVFLKYVSPNMLLDFSTSPKTQHTPRTWRVQT